MDGLCAAPASCRNESPASQRTSLSGQMTHGAVLYVRRSWVEIMKFYAEKPSLFRLHSLCKTLGSQPGLVTRGRGDAGPWCPSCTAWPSPLGLFQRTHLFWFLPRNVNQMWGTSLWWRPSVLATAMADRPPLALCPPLAHSRSSQTPLNLPFP